MNELREGDIRWVYKPTEQRLVLQQYKLTYDGPEAGGRLCEWVDVHTICENEKGKQNG